MNIGPYEYRKSLAKGGMGEVILAFDPFFKREIAVKKIRSDIKKNEILKTRFLREAQITAQLTHPGVITIYSIHQEGDEIYYTMPYIEGKTLKEILRMAPPIVSLLPIFKSICQTVAYAHSKKIIHRDLKPENILVGNFGETIILDWGLAQSVVVPMPQEEEGEDIAEEGLTMHGKIVGTLPYMAPERALGAPASFQSDIYALGVILYQLLTIRLPFIRTTAKEFRKNYHLETWIDPEEMAPYRDVSPRLSSMVKRCLAIDLTKRYKSVEELLEDLSGHMEGRSEWFEITRLNIDRKKDWEIKENILLTKHLAISSEIESTEWMSILISKASFSENTRIETWVTLHEKEGGIGFLLSVPEAQERVHPLEGYCLWLGGEDEKSSELFRNQTLVLQIPDLFLSCKKHHKILIEKIDTKIHISLDGVHKFTYLSYLPLLGTHVGLLYRSQNFDIDDVIVSVSSPTLQVSCLAIPDAFLASKDYKKALAEYRRIGYSFPGHAEGREALFRAGITLLEQGKSARSEKKAKEYFSLSIEEFARLHTTPGAPLEYLGKSLVYQTLKEYPEEVKCLEFGLRRYHKHPLVHAIIEEILYRMQEASQKDRKSAYELILISLRHIPHAYETSERLFKHLITHWEPLYFMENPITTSKMGSLSKENEIAFAIQLAFWLANPIVFSEIFADILKFTPQDDVLLGNLLFSLCELGDISLAKSFIASLTQGKEVFNPIFLCYEGSLKKAVAELLQSQEFNFRYFRTFLYVMQYSLFRSEEEEIVHTLAKSTLSLPLSKEERIQIDAFEIWAYLKEEKYPEAEKIFNQYSLELLSRESTLLHPLYGCYLCATEGEDIALAHLSGVVDTPFPRSYALLGHAITGKILEKPDWLSTSFMWERRQLYRQLTLYYQCAEKGELENSYRLQEKKEYL